MLLPAQARPTQDWSVWEPGAVDLCWSLQSKFQVVVQMESGFLFWTSVYFLFLIRKGNQTLYSQLYFDFMTDQPNSKLVLKGNKVYMIALAAVVLFEARLLGQIWQGNECFMWKCLSASW